MRSFAENFGDVLLIVGGVLGVFAAAVLAVTCLVAMLDQDVAGFLPRRWHHLALFVAIVLLFVTIIALHQTLNPPEPR